LHKFTWMHLIILIVCCWMLGTSFMSFF
jgi:hypothetical protein